MPDYKGIGPNRGLLIAEEDSLAWALEQTGIQLQNPDAPVSREFLKAFIEWFYSGNFCPVEREEGYIAEHHGTASGVGPVSGTVG